MLERRELALDRAAEHVARLGIDVVAQQQARAVADVLNRMRQVVDETGGNPAEHRLAFLPLHVLLQLDELVGHGVEGLTQLGEFVARADVHALFQAAGGKGLRAALQREDRSDELTTEEIADGNHYEKRDRDRDDELALKHTGVRVRVARRLLDDHRPAERRHRRGHAELLVAVFVGVLARDGPLRAAGGAQGHHQRMRAHVARLRDQCFLVRVAVRDQFAV